MSLVEGLFQLFNLVAREYRPAAAARVHVVGCHRGGALRAFVVLFVPIWRRQSEHRGRSID